MYPVSPVSPDGGYPSALSPSGSMIQWPSVITSSDACDMLHCLRSCGLQCERWQRRASNIPGLKRNRLAMPCFSGHPCYSWLFMAIHGYSVSIGFLIGFLKISFSRGTSRSLRNLLPRSEAPPHQHPPLQGRDSLSSTSKWWCSTSINENRVQKKIRSFWAKVQSH